MPAFLLRCRPYARVSGYLRPHCHSYSFLEMERMLTMWAQNTPSVQIIEQLLILINSFCNRWMFNRKSWLYASVIIETTVEGFFLFSFSFLLKWYRHTVVMIRKKKDKDIFSLMRAKARPFPPWMGACRLVAGIIQIQTLSRGRRFPVQLHWAVLLGAVQPWWMPRVLAYNARFHRDLFLFSCSRLHFWATVYN